MAKVSIVNVSQIERHIKESIATNQELILPIAGFKGLEIRIRPSQKTDKATTDFRHRYTHPITGKRPYLSLGNYPAFSLAQAKQAYTDNLVLLEQGIDPKEHREQEREQKAHSLDSTFKAVADDWLAEQTNNPDHVLAEQTLKNWGFLLEPLLNEFAETPIDTITTPQVLRLLKQVQKTHIQKGNRVKGIASRIFAHAVINGLIEHNPVTAVKEARALKPTRQKHHPAIIEPQELALLLNEIDSLPSGSGNFNKEILQLLALTFARIGDICTMKWAEIDMSAKQWEFEPQKGVNRNDMVDSLVIPLAPQTIAILERMREITGSMEYVFYNGRRKAKPYADGQQVNKLLNSQSMNKAKIGKDFCNRGYFGVHSPHGFRATARTILEERLNYDYRLIEMQLGHNVRDSNGRAYNRVKWLDKRHKMMTDWANYLDKLKAGKVDNVIYFDKVKDKLQVNEK